MKVIYLGNKNKENLENAMRVVASAGLLSRSEGVVSDVVNSRNDFKKNVDIIRKITNYEHRSITEHQYLVFALEDVTPIIEQILINHRLASFTIKSRRNVDFREVGLFVPDFKYKDGKIILDNTYYQEKYKKHMQRLFSEYGKLVDMQLPIEDCRYILPYCYHSNIIMGCDANELLKIVSRLKYGKESKITEVRELGDKLEQIMSVVTPYFAEKLKRAGSDIRYQDNLSFLDEIVDFGQNLICDAKLTKYIDNADEVVCISILKNRRQFTDDAAKKELDRLKKNDPNIQERMIMGLLKNDKAREFEQVNFSYSLPISLAALTHITRHRMHSLMVPDFAPMWNLENYIIPPSIEESAVAENYHDIFKANKETMEEFKKAGIRDEDLVYFYLSGNCWNVSTTMNARSLIWISRMRCCKKAQWEIRELINKCVEETSSVAPLIGECLGPTCKVKGYCPEGKDSCKKGLVIKRKR